MGKRILFISSVDPTKGPGRLALDTCEAMRRGGYSVDFYTQYTVSDHPEIHALCGDGPGLPARIRDFVFTRMQKPAYYFFYRREEHPPVPVRNVVKQLQGTYDMIYIMFWQGLLSFETVQKISEEIQAPVVLAPVDMSVMTGGCHYPHACTRYQQECGHCPGLKQPLLDSFTRHNVLYRESFYERVDPVILTNSFIAGFYRESRLLRDRKIVTMFPIVDEQQFCPKDKVPLRERFGIPAHKEFIMLAGAQNFQDDRKGGRYLVAALDLFHEGLSDEEREKVLLLCVGNMDAEMEQAMRFDHKSLGYVSLDVLADLYALSDVFLSPSVEDGGPLMVNQAISCGTPVVCFKIGTALDVVDGKGTGYCARLRDAEDFAEGILQYYRADREQRESASARCRKLAMETTSFKAFSRFIDRLFDMIPSQ